MKKPLLVLLTLFPLLAVAAEQPALTFREYLAGLQPFFRTDSLTEIAKLNSLGASSDTTAGSLSKSTPVVEGTKFVSSMPILSPPGNLDPKMIKSPDSSIDYKLIVKGPDIASRK